MMKWGAAPAALVVLAAVVLVFANVARHPQYTPDGIVYARFAARDAGYSERDATLSARRFYERTPLARASPRYRQLVEIDPRRAFPASRIFENRVLYPWVTSLLLPRLGFRALFVVSAISYVAFGCALYWLLLAFGGAWIAAAITIVALLLPMTRQLGASDLTDMLAAVWWALAIGALLRCVRRPQAGVLALLAVAGVLLVLTRPTPYLVVIPAAVCAVVRRTWMPLAAACVGVAAFAALAAASHAYGISAQLQWVFTHEPHARFESFQAWYRASLAASIRYAIVQAVRTVLPALLIAAAIVAAARAKARDEMLVLIAAAVSCCIAILFNPVPSAIPRVVVFPLLPIFCAIAQGLAATLFVPTRGSQKERSPEPAIT